MISVFNEVKKLRGGKSMVIDRRNSNRYFIAAAESNGTKTAYCFGVPVYNKKTRKLLDLCFYNNSGVWCSEGSCARISVTEEILFEDEDRYCRLLLPEKIFSCSAQLLRCGAAEILPTVNGLFFRILCPPGQAYKMTLLSDRPHMSLRSNGRFFSLMKEWLTPLITVSCIGAANGEGRIVAPCFLSYQKISDCEYSVEICHTCPSGAYMQFEINLHEPKLFQDTTVESLHPDLNNAFGGTAFIGTTAAYGEQWLYLKPDFIRLSELYDRQILKAVLHLPEYGGDSVLTAFGLTSRFCSFGSVWDNKIPESEEISDAFRTEGYQSLDITRLITDRSGFFKTADGIIIRPKIKGSGFSAVATGDSYYAPQILEVNFR